ncbi:MAG: hypothetical protein JXM73_26480 [Anaerolineae bacterium]|nr:hypothetical protein [Anaerolineae bacterium]
MNPSKVGITDRDGWYKEFELGKNLIYIGSDPSNDIALPVSRGAGIAPRHLQLVRAQGDRQQYHVVNLGDTDVALGQSGDRILAPRSAADIAPGDRLQLGEFALVFFAGTSEASWEPVAVTSNRGPERGMALYQPAAAQEQYPSTVIGLKLLLPHTTLDPIRPLTGAITLRNLGNKPGVQFKLEVEGLEPDCYDIGPGPILFPNAEKEVPLRLHHPRRPQLPAGEHRIAIHASAPEAYPGEIATVSQTLRFLPYYHHTLRLVAAAPEANRSGVEPAKGKGRD